MFGAFRFRWAMLLASLLLGTAILSGCGSSEERAQAYYKSGVELAANGEPIKAALEFRNALKLKQNFVEALFALGQVQEQQGQFEEAARVYVAVAEQSSDHIQARVHLSNILMAAGQLDQALKYADQALALDESDPAALVAKAAVELKLDNRGEAVRLSKAALEIDPELVDALIVLASERLLASDPASALEILDRAPDSGDRNLGLQVLRLSVLDALNDQPEVERLFEKLSKLYPDTPAFRQALAKWYLSKGRKADAEKVVRQFAADNAADDQAQLGLISFLNEERGPEVAIAELQDMIAARASNETETFSLQMALTQLLYSTGDHSKATDLLQTLVSDTGEEKNKNLARLQLAKVALADKDMSRAEQLVDAVLASDAKNVDALFVRASIRIFNGNNADAAADILEALNEQPDDVRLHSLLAQSYERDGLVVLAEEQYSKAFALDKNSAATGLPMAQFFLRYGKNDQALRVLEAVRTRAPNDSRVLTLLAQLKLAAKDWVGAQEVAEALRKLNADENAVDADKIAAAALGGLNRNADSIGLLQSSLVNGADNQAVLGDLVAAYVRAGKQSTAETFLKSVLETDPENLQAQILLGSVYMTMDSIDLAETAFQKASAIKDGVAGDAALAQFYVTTGQLEAAEAAARAGLESDPESNALHLLLASIYERQERYEDAIAEYETLFKANPGSTVVANDLASLLSERRGDKAALDRAYEIAQRFRNSEIPQYLDTLGWIYYLRGEYPSALPLLKSAAEKLPNLALIQYHLGMVLNRLEQGEASTAALEKAISLSPPLVASDLEKAQAALEANKSAASAGASN